MKLLKIVDLDCVDIVLMAVPDDYDEERALQEARDSAGFDDFAAIEDEQFLTGDFLLDEYRPFVG